MRVINFCMRVEAICCGALMIHTHAVTGDNPVWMVVLLSLGVCYWIGYTWLAYNKVEE